MSIIVKLVVCLIGIDFGISEQTTLNLECGYIVTSENATFSEQSQGSLGFYDSILPSSIVYCKCENDVILTMQYISNNNIPFSIRSGGHSFGGFNKIQDRLLIDLSNMNAVNVNTINVKKNPFGKTKYHNIKILTVEPGATTNDVLTYLNDTGNTDIIIPVGLCPTVGMGGYVQGGGASFYSRAIGLAVDFLIGARVILENGKIVNANLNNKNSDLLYAIKGGGGGNWGVITQYTFEPKTNLPGNVSFYDLVYPVNNVNDLISFLHAERYVLQLTQVDHFTDISEAPSGTIINFHMMYYPRTENDFSIGDHIYNEFRAIAESHGNQPTSEVITISNIHEIMINVVQRPAFNFARLPGVIVHRQMLDNYALSNSFIYTFAHQLYNDISRNNNVDILVLSNSYGHGQIYYNDPFNRNSAFINRDSLGAFAVVVLYYDDVFKDEGFETAKSYNEKLDEISNTQYINYIENAIGSNDIESLYCNNENVLRKLIKIKNKYDPNNIFNFNLSIPIKQI